MHWVVAEQSRASAYTYIPIPSCTYIVTCTIDAWCASAYIVPHATNYLTWLWTMDIIWYQPASYSYNTKTKNEKETVGPTGSSRSNIAHHGQILCLPSTCCMNSLDARFVFFSIFYVLLLHLYSLHSSFNFNTQTTWSGESALRYPILCWTRHTYLYLFV
jgi:hypothetical protein